MAKRIRIDNCRDCMVNVNLKSLNGKVIPVMPRGFVTLSEEEFEYVVNTSQVFKKGTLKVHDTDNLPENVDKNSVESPNALTDEDIEKMLKGKQTTIEKKLQEVTEVDTMKRVLAKAEDMDKGVKVVGAIEDRLEELMS